MDAGPVRAHVVALRGSGLAWKKIARLSGVPVQTVKVLVNGRPGRPLQKMVLRSTADALFSVRVGEVSPVGNDLVCAVGSQRRLKALVSAGWTASMLGDDLGMKASDVMDLMLRREHVRAWKHAQIKGLFERLQLVPGPSEYARRVGRRNRWPLPFQWDEDAIDDPSRGPVHLTRREPYMKRSAA
ncbi:hypothetical protein [Nocardia wallacei]|uniref:hypothetical protein n=1 Tax=Nocardia wallacei TaxID=480035 RepID=UPI0024550D7F|nr:hypothetical protein [Nocardia wallacei]